MVAQMIQLFKKFKQTNFLRTLPDSINMLSRKEIKSGPWCDFIFDIFTYFNYILTCFKLPKYNTF